MKNRKYTIYLIPVKIYEKDPVFFVKKTIRCMQNLSLKLAKVLYNDLSNSKPMLTLFQCFPVLWSHQGL